MGFLSQESRPMAPCILVHGLHGKGKTERAVRGGRPFVITTELKSRNRVRKINPEADGFYPENLVELEKLLEILGSDKFRSASFDRVVLDSYTELTNSLPDWIILRHSPNLRLDPGRIIERQEYGPIQNWALAIVEGLMLTGLPVVLLCRSEAKDGMTALMSTGSSAKHLSSKVNATFEAIFDQEIGYLWTSEPSPSSPRCGLEEVPHKWNGSTLELLQLIAGPAGLPEPGAGPEPTPEPTVDPAHARAEAKARGIAAPAKTLGDVVANVQEALKDAPGQVSQEAQDFVDSVSPPPAEGADIRALLDLCEANREVDQARLLNYFRAHKGLSPVQGREATFSDLTAAAVAAVSPILRDENRRRAFVAHLNNGSYNAAPAAPTSAQR